MPQRQGKRLRGQKGKAASGRVRHLSAAPEVEVAAGYLDVVMMACHVFDALCREFGDAFAVQDEVFQLPVNVLLVGQDVDDGAQAGFVEDGIVFGFAASHYGQALGHGEQGVHGGGVGVELVQLDVGVVHQLPVAGVGDVVHLGDAAEVGVAPLHLAEDGDHDIRPLQVAARRLHAHEEVEDFGHTAHTRDDPAPVDGQGDEDGLPGEVGMVGDVVFPQAGDDSVAGLGNGAGGAGGGAVVPVLEGGAVEGGVAVAVADLEVGVSEGVGLHAGAGVVVVGAEGSQEYLGVVALEVAVDGQGAFAPQAEEVGADELDHVVSAEFGQVAQEAQEAGDAVAQAVRRAVEGDVVRVVAPAAAVGGYGDVASQGAQAFGKVPVQAAKFSK